MKMVSNVVVSTEPGIECMISNELVSIVMEPGPEPARAGPGHCSRVSYKNATAVAFQNSV